MNNNRMNKIYTLADFLGESLVVLCGVSWQY